MNGQTWIVPCSFCPLRIFLFKQVNYLFIPFIHIHLLNLWPFEHFPYNCTLSSSYYHHSLSRKKTSHDRLNQCLMIYLFIFLTTLNSIIHIARYAPIWSLYHFYMCPSFCIHTLNRCYILPMMCNTQFRPCIFTIDNGMRHYLCIIPII